MSISSFGEDEAGEIYVVGHEGAIVRITNPDATTGATRNFVVANRGGSTFETAGASSALLVGYARIQADSPPSGLAVFEYRQGGVLVSETSIPASSLIQSGRIYADVGIGVNTGIAIANPNPEPVTISFFFTDANGSDFRQDSTTIPAGRQIAKFLDQAPFNAGGGMRGTFTFTASAGVSVIALRGFTNERSEFLMTALPVASLTAAAGTITLPHFADGGDWITRIGLVNPTDGPLTGEVQFFTAAGQPLRALAYSIAARSSTLLTTSGAGAAVQTGSARIVPAPGNVTPSGFNIFTFRPGGVTVSETGIQALGSGLAFRSYVENQGPIRTGIAVANPSAVPVTVSLELTRLDGSSAGLAGVMNIPANGQAAAFLNEIPGFSSLPSGFKGVLRIASSSEPVAVTSIRSRTNERNEFLMTAIPPVNEISVAPDTELVFPHFADGGGYTMQFVLFSGRAAGQASSGAVHFFTQSGQPAALEFR